MRQVVAAEEGEEVDLPFFLPDDAVAVLGHVLVEVADRDAGKVPSVDLRVVEADVDALGGSAGRGHVGRDVPLIVVDAEDERRRGAIIDVEQGDRMGRTGLRPPAALARHRAFHFVRSGLQVGDRDEVGHRDAGDA